MLAGPDMLVAGLMERVRGAARSRYRGAALGDFAPLTGAELADEVEQHPPFGRLQLEPAALIRAGLTTAAVPRPTPIAWTRADLDVDARLGARALARTGLAGRGRSSDCLDGGLVAPGTLAVADALDWLDALALPVGPLTTDAALQRAAEVWEIVRPHVLICDAPSYAFLTAAGYQRPDAFAVLLTPNDAVALAAPPRAGVFRVFSVPQVATFVAGECAAHAGYHLAADAVLAEIVDASGRPVREGGGGRLLLTTLLRSLALLRFDTGLRAGLDAGPCSCGDDHPRLRFDVG